MRLISGLLALLALAGIAVALLSVSPSGLAALSNAAPVPETADATNARVIENDRSQEVSGWWPNQDVTGSLP